MQYKCLAGFVCVEDLTSCEHIFFSSAMKGIHNLQIYNLDMMEKRKQSIWANACMGEIIIFDGSMWLLSTEQIELMIECDVNTLISF